jgi:protein TonB
MAESSLRQHDAGFWRALPWAVLCWLLLLWLLGRVLTPSQPEVVASPPVDARIVELPDTSAAPRQETPVPPQQQQPTPAAPQARLTEPEPAPLATRAEPVPAPPAPVAMPPPAPTAKAVVGVETHGAQALRQPSPDIPDALLDEAAGQSVTARFHVAADGSATVELVKATANPALNRSILATLKKWTFAPAMQAGKAVEAVQEVSFSF